MSQFARLPIWLAAIFRCLFLASASSGAPAFGTAGTGAGDRDGVGAPVSGTAVPGGRNEGGIGIEA